MTEQWTHIPVPGVGVAAHLGRCSPQVDVLASGEVGAKDGRCSPCLVSTGLTPTWRAQKIGGEVDQRVRCCRPCALQAVGNLVDLGV